jgi:hypothetical protein
MKPMVRWAKLTVLSFPFAIMLAFTFGEGQLPPVCGFLPEPTLGPNCGGSPNCAESNPCDGPKGWQYGYCCYESAFDCKQFTGRWECCNNQWQAECVAEWTGMSVCGNDHKCYG